MGRPCARTAREWHAAALRAAEAGALQVPPGEPDPDAPGEAARALQAAWHAGWLGRLERPDDPATRLTVSVLVPVRDRAALAAEAVASALAQTWRPLEVIVVDDGSRDDLAGALAGLGVPVEDEEAGEPPPGGPPSARATLRLLRQEPRGVAAARNLGLARARGELVAFLDSDDLLDPTFVATAVGAFAAVPDADLFWACPRDARDADPDPPPMIVPPTGRGDPTEDLLAVVVRRHPFLILGTAVPRWLALAVGGFDERLRVGEDTLFFLRLGLRGAKCVGWRAKLNERRALPDGLTARHAGRPLASRGVQQLAGLSAMLARPATWEHLPALLETVTHRLSWQSLALDEPEVVAARAEAAAAIEGVARESRASAARRRRALDALDAAWRRAARWHGAEGTVRARRQLAEATGRARAAAAAGGLRAPALLQALRPRQWAKNLLVGVPLAAAHRLDEPELLAAAGLGAAAFSLVASAGYVVNDLLDVEADRRHPRKRERPFARGALGARQGAWLAAACAGAGMLLAALVLPAAFAGWLAAYLVLTAAYSLFVKRQLLWDVVLLAALYTLRILAGGAAIGLAVSEWLLAFSMFLFLSLAFAKRYGELAMLAREDGPDTARGYRVEERSLVAQLGTGCGLLSVLVFSLYVNSDKVGQLYSHGRLLWLSCPVLLVWVLRLWFVARRGQLDDDPFTFALGDRTSWAAAAVLAAIFVAAT